MEPLEIVVLDSLEPWDATARNKALQALSGTPVGLRGDFVTAGQTQKKPLADLPGMRARWSPQQRQRGRRRGQHGSGGQQRGCECFRLWST